MKALGRIAWVCYRLCIAYALTMPCMSGMSMHGYDYAWSGCMDYAWSMTMH